MGKKLRGAAVRARRNGKCLCAPCWKDCLKYYADPFVKSLEFKPARLARKRGLKPLPGQMELLATEQFREAGRSGDE